MFIHCTLKLDTKQYYMMTINILFTVDILLPGLGSSTVDQVLKYTKYPN